MIVLFEWPLLFPLCLCICNISICPLPPNHSSSLQPQSRVFNPTTTPGPSSWPIRTQTHNDQTSEGNVEVPHRRSVASLRQAITDKLEMKSPNNNSGNRMRNRDTYGKNTNSHRNSCWFYRFQSQRLLPGRRASRSTNSTESTKTSRIWAECSMGLSHPRNTFKE